MCGPCLSRAVPTLARGLGFLPGKWAHALLCRLLEMMRVKRSEEPLLEPLSSADASPLANRILQCWEQNSSWGC